MAERMTLLNFTPPERFSLFSSSPERHLEGFVALLVLEGSEDHLEVHLVSEEADLYRHPVARQVPYAPFINRDSFIYCYPL